MLETLSHKALKVKYYKEVIAWTGGQLVQKLV